METYKHKMDAVNILRGFTDCLTFPFSKIYKATFYHCAAQIHVYLKRAHQVSDNTNIQFELLSNLLHKDFYDILTVNNGHRFHRSWPVNIKQLLTREALTMMRYSPENISIDRDDTLGQY